MRPTLTPRGERYRGKSPAARMRQQAVFYNARRSSVGAVVGRWVVVNAEGKPLCQPTSRDEALKLRGSAGGRIEQR